MTIRLKRGFNSIGASPTFGEVATGTNLRRLFWTFARGWPGAGLLLMRVAAGVPLIQHAASTFIGAPTIGAGIVEIIAGGAGVLLVAGLWTPLAGALVTIIELRMAFTRPGDPLIHIILASLAAGLALVGPGAWSIDARLYGGMRVDLPTPKR